MASNYLITKTVFKTTGVVNEDNLEPYDLKILKTYQMPTRAKQEDRK